jgi:RNase P/RNase MRP subunit p29
MKKIGTAGEIKNDLQKMAVPYTEDNLSKISKDIETLKFQAPQGTTQSRVNQYLKGAKGSIDEAIELLKPGASKKVRRYEIKIAGGQTTLVKVPVSKEIQ